MKHISIIGGNGFLGKVLCNQLSDAKMKHTVFDVNLHDNQENIIHCDVRDKKSLEIIEKDSVIVNLAAVHRDDVRPVSKYDDVNVGGAINICEVAREKKIKTIIFTSSVAVYGFADPGTDENGKINFFNDYGRTKYLAEKEYEKWFQEDPQSRNLIILRPTVIFGEDNRGNVYNLLNQIASKKFVMFGNGKNIKSMAYVENVAEFIRFIIKSDIKGFKKFNYVDKPDLNMNELTSFSRNILFNKSNVGIRLPSFFGFLLGYLADIIGYLINKPLPVSSIRVKKFMSTTSFSTNIDNKKFIPKYTLKEGLLKTLNYEFKKNKL